MTVVDDASDPNWNLFFDLYQQAVRSVTGWDRVLSEIEEELEKKGAIGLP